MHTHDVMHQQYRRQDFDSAIATCKALRNDFDGQMNGYYDMWIERCEYMKTQDLPDIIEWDGVFIATSN